MLVVVLKRLDLPLAAKWATADAVFVVVGDERNLRRGDGKIAPVFQIELP